MCHVYMSERFLKKTWKVTPDELVDAGVAFKTSQASKTKSKKFALYQLYEYVKHKGVMGDREANEAVHTEIQRIMKNRDNSNKFRSREYSGYGADNFCPFQCCAETRNVGAVLALCLETESIRWTYNYLFNWMINVVLEGIRRHNFQ